MNEPALLQLRGVRKSFAHGAFALHVQQLDIAAGQVICLVGPTGSGKSTLLRLLAAVETPCAGQILFAGRPLAAATSPTATRRRITMVFQNPFLVAGSVRSNVEYGLWLRGKSGRRALVDRILHQFGLDRLAPQSVRSLSGGERQLVALARALAVEPELLLLDEPTAHLDPAHVALVEDVVRQDHLRRGTTVVWATHHLFQTRRVADQAGLLLGGRLVEMAAIRTFFESPTDPRTSDFVQGKMVY